MLRAHLLTPRRIDDLLSLRARTGIRLALVCHRRTMPSALERALRTVPHHLADATAVLPETDLEPDPHPPRHPAPRPLANRWINLPALTTLASVDDHQRRCRCTPRLARDRNFHPPRMPPATAAEVAYRLPAATAHPHLAAALAAAVVTAASTTQLDTAHRADLAADASTLALHDPNGLRTGCLTHPVPPWARPVLLAAAYLHMLAPADSDTPLFASPFADTGLPYVTDVAEACKLRPPQPPRPRRRRGARPRLPQETVWPVSNAHHHSPWAVEADMLGCPPPPPHTRPR